MDQAIDDFSATDLAEDRTLLASERTFAGWVRTSLGCIAIGIGFHALFARMQPPWVPKAIASLFPPPDPSLPPILERVPEKSRPAFAALLKKSGLDPAMLSRMPTWQASFMLMGAMMKDLGIQRDAGVEDSLVPVFAPPSPDAKDASPRKVEALETGKPVTPFLSFGDSVRIEMLDGEGRSIFGAIEQRIERYAAA